MDLAHVTWRKSTRSGSQSDCVEVASAADQVAAGDSKHPDGGALVFSRAEFGAFLRTLKGHERE